MDAICDLFTVPKLMDAIAPTKPTGMHDIALTKPTDRQAHACCEVLYRLVRAIPASIDQEHDANERYVLSLHSSTSYCSMS